MILNLKRGSPIFKLCLLTFAESSSAFSSSTTKLFTVRRNLSLFMQKDSPLGGDYAGLSATFNPKDGSFIPIPEYLVPESLLEWGQEPKCLEVLVSEEEEDTGDETMERTTVTVLPAVGCAIDNLDTTVKKDQVDLNSIFRDNTKAVGLQYWTGDNSIRLETIFGLIADDDDDYYRMRVVVDLLPVQSEDIITVKSPMNLVLERKTSPESSGGSVADGGGLDARTVSRLLGPELTKSKTFAEEDVTQEGDDSSSSQNNGVSINLPGDVTLSYSASNDGWNCQISHTQDGLTRTVSRVFNQDSKDFKVTSSEEKVLPVA